MNRTRAELLALLIRALEVPVRIVIPDYKQASSLRFAFYRAREKTPDGRLIEIKMAQNETTRQFEITLRRKPQISATTIMELTDG